MRFDDRAVLILGGTAGIGLAAARLFQAEGARLAVTGRNPDGLRAVSEELGVPAIRSDMGVVAESVAAIAAAREALGDIDVLFVNAGIGGFAAVPDVTEPFWDEIHAVNLRGAFFAIQAALPLMREGGSIVITGSIGSVAALEGNAVYAAAKAGLRAVARILAKELLPRRIRVNMISPGPTDTEIFKRGVVPQEVEALRAMMAAAVPIGRMATSEEVARAALFLASSDAAFINGVDLYVDGGCLELG